MDGLFRLEGTVVTTTGAQTFFIGRIERVQDLDQIPLLASAGGNKDHGPFANPRSTEETSEDEDATDPLVQAAAGQPDVQDMASADEDLGDPRFSCSPCPCPMDPADAMDVLMLDATSNGNTSQEESGEESSGGTSEVEETSGDKELGEQEEEEEHEDPTKNDGVLAPVRQRKETMIEPAGYEGYQLRQARANCDLEETYDQDKDSTLDQPKHRDQEDAASTTASRRAKSESEEEEDEEEDEEQPDKNNQAVLDKDVQMEDSAGEDDNGLSHQQPRGRKRKAQEEADDVEMEDLEDGETPGQDFNRQAELPIVSCGKCGGMRSARRHDAACLKKRRLTYLFNLCHKADE